MDRAARASISTPIDAVSTNTTSSAIKILNKGLVLDPNKIGILIFGTFVASVEIECTIATDAEVDAATATWKTLSGASWTDPESVSIALPFTHFRFKVVWTSGTSISVKIFKG